MKKEFNKGGITMKNIFASDSLELFKANCAAKSAGVTKAKSKDEDLEYEAKTNSAKITSKGYLTQNSVEIEF